MYCWVGIAYLNGSELPHQQTHKHAHIRWSPRRQCDALLSVPFDNLLMNSSLRLIGISDRFGVCLYASAYVCVVDIYGNGLKDIEWAVILAKPLCERVVTIRLFVRDRKGWEVESA